LMVYASGLWVLIKTALPGYASGKKKVLRIGREDLQALAEGVYVDSPVYFARNPVVRWINWKKLDAALALPPPGEESWVLDFCCGNGVLLPTLSRRHRKTLGIDLQPDAAARVKRAYGLGNVFLLGADGRAIPFRNESFSVVFALSALEHFRDPVAAVNEIARVMKPEGSFIFLSPTESRFYRLGRGILGYSRPADHYHTAEEIEKILEEVFSPVQKGNFPWNAMPRLSMYRLGRYRKR
jgi:ubiquinone/menaquinone biosynthesis C-methylase UbiE